MFSNLAQTGPLDRRDVIQAIITAVTISFQTSAGRDRTYETYILLASATNILFIILWNGICIQSVNIEHCIFSLRKCWKNTIYED